MYGEFNRCHVLGLPPLQAEVECARCRGNNVSEMLEIEDGIIPARIVDVKCVLADFSSGYDDFSGRNLYGNGPSSEEQTDEYAPPEVLLQGSSWEPFSRSNPFSYDSWSIGVVALGKISTSYFFSINEVQKMQFICTLL